MKKNKMNIEEQVVETFDEYRNLNRNEYFYLPGRILHLDSDI